MPAIEVTWYSWALPLAVTSLGREMLIIHIGPLRLVWGDRSQTP